MYAPPEIIHVKRLKRKAHDDDDDDDQQGAVNYLRIDDKDRKRYRSDVYVYQRTTQDSLEGTNNAAPHSRPDVVPIIHSSKPDSNWSSAKRQDAAQNPHLRDASRTTSSAETQQRRFHFSRPMIQPTSILSTIGLKTGKRSRHNTPTTIFVERGHKRTKTEDVEMQDVDAAATQDDGAPIRKLKLPGSDRKGPRAHDPVAIVKRPVAQSLEPHWAGDELDEMTRSMNDFALQLIGANLAETEERDRKQAAAAARKVATSTVASTTPQRFKPKAPAKRYAERHPEITAAQHAVEPQEEVDIVSEDEYVVETYVRVPASALSKDIAPDKVGLLVFDNEPDADFFYGEEGDSDDELAEDDEDENAENYYTADYPDEEVDSEDEYDRGAYLYRTGNASDLEEFDERDDAFENDLDEDNAPIPFSTRLGAMPPSAFRR
ncbi:hypothetical protein BD289DRAFT_480717 [Coniella lustricola]|uniref:Transcription factor Iwr1 domain-containing protein n=1 Tax=Coniella lustricola TaxID=2025994 RepID=A0A2T3AES8_9PEZI|nr:hypothetical protein BD289DRAFT_480717 [Coniella lustricola]